jgi:hypothetical protein
VRSLLASAIVLLALIAPPSAHGQPPDPRLALPPLELRRIDIVPPSAAARPLRVSVDGLQARGVSPGWLVAAGVVGGGLGMVAGAVGGAVIDGRPDDDCIDFCFGPGFVLGALAGEALGVAAAVHLANGRKGSFLLDLATSAGVLARGLAVGHEAPAAGLLVPVSQVFGTVVVERNTEHARRGILPPPN